MSTELVPDPVGHISISGVHGRDELDERLANPPRPSRRARAGGLETLLVGAAVGATLMYLFDPAQGSRRRSLLRDQIAHALNTGEDRLARTEHDLRNRAEGIVAEVKSRLTPDSSNDPAATAEAPSAQTIGLQNSTL